VRLVGSLGQGPSPGKTVLRTRESPFSEGFGFSGPYTFTKDGTSVGEVKPTLKSQELVRNEPPLFHRRTLRLTLQMLK